MKFACGRCGKRYASVEPPVPGRVYRIRCRACGHLIEVKGPDPAVQPPPQPRHEPARLADDLFAEEPGLEPRPDGAPPSSDPLAPVRDGGAERAEPAPEARPTPVVSAPPPPRRTRAALRAVLVAIAVALAAAATFTVW